MAQAVYDSHPLQEYLEGSCTQDGNYSLKILTVVFTESDLESLAFPGAFVASQDDEDVGFEGLDLTWVPPNVLHFLQVRHIALFKRAFPELFLFRTCTKGLLPFGAHFLLRITTSPNDSSMI